MLWGNPTFGVIEMLVAWQAFDVIFYPIFWVAVGVIYPIPAFRTLSSARRAGSAVVAPV